MAIDIKAKIEEIVKKLTSDQNLLKNFEQNPTGTVEKLIGVDLPDDPINQIVAGVKAKLNVGGLKGVADKLGNLFGKK